MYLIDRNFCWNKFPQILRVVAEFAKISIRKTFQFWRLAKTNTHKNFCKKARVFKEKIKLSFINIYKSFFTVFSLHLM